MSGSGRGRAMRRTAVTGFEGGGYKGMRSTGKRGVFGVVRRRGGGTVVRRAGWLTALTMILLTLVPPANAAEVGTGGFPLPDLGTLFVSAVSWTSAPKQTSGSAAGKSHTATADSTRAGRGNGKPRGKGIGELPPATPASAPKVAAGPSGRKPVGFDAKTSKENPAKRTKTTKTYDNADGTTSVDYYSGPVNYTAPDGTLQPIDTTLVAGPKPAVGSQPKAAPAAGSAGSAGAPSTGSTGGSTSAASVTSATSPTSATNTAGRLIRAAADSTVSFATSGDDPALETVGDGKNSVSFSLAGAAAVAPTTSGSQATYPSILPGVDLRLLANNTGAKETLVVTSASAPATYVFPYVASAGLTAKLVSGGVQFVDAAGAGVFVPDAIAVDSAASPAGGAQSNDIAYSLITTADGRPALRMTLDATWLHDPSRVFPVLVDPSVGPIQSNDTATMDTSTSPMGTYSGDLKIGNDGSRKAAAFVQFTGVTAVKNLDIVSATVNLWHTESKSCTLARQIYLNSITANWNVSSISSYPGVAYDNSAVVGSLNLTGGGSNCGGSQWEYIPLNSYGIDLLHRWAIGNMINYGFLVTGDPADAYTWRQFSSYAEGGVTIPSLTVTFQNVPPQVDTTYPANASSLGTLTPELLATAHDPDGYPAGAQLKYDFQVKDSNNNTVADSASITSGDWTVPTGKLQWNQTYSWTVQVTDTANSTTSIGDYFTLAPPQPPITSTLSQNSERGFDAGGGNYTTSATDVDVAGVGPSLQVARDYNSQDPRITGAFGAAWSSIFDAKASEQYLPNPQNLPTPTVGSVNVTYPDGSEIGWGRNSDGTFAAPSGRYSQLKQITGGYSLTDKNDTTYTFTQSLGGGVYGITSVADAFGRTVTFGWSGGSIATMTSGATGRTLTLTWSTPPGATVPHVHTVVTNPATAGNPATAQTWTYNYSGDQLASVCSPVDGSTTGTGCTQYSYTPGSPFAAAVLNSGPQSYWRLNELSGTTAASSVLENEGGDNQTYTGVTLAQPTGLTGSGATSAGFAGGTASYVASTSSNAAVTGSYVSVGAWFKTTTAGGVIFYYGDQPLSKAAGTVTNTPALYVGTDGKLHGCFASPSCTSTPPSSTATVTDGNWHYALLSGMGSKQTLYLDGLPQGTPLAATISSGKQPYIAIGAGVGGHGWPYLSSGVDGFTGSLSDVALWSKPLNDAQVAYLYGAGQRSTSLLTKVTKPSGKVEAAVAYNPMTGAEEQVTDDKGGVWTVPAPTAAGSSQVYRSVVLGAAPTGYWRLGDPAGYTTATDEVADNQDMVYDNATLGQAGVFGDTTAASFSGTASNASSGPGSVIDTSQSFSVSAWVKLSDTSGYHAAVVQTNTNGGFGFWLGYDHSLNAWALTTVNNVVSPTVWYSAAGTTGSVQTGVWTHLVGTFTKSTGRLALYVNGVLQNRQDIWPSPVAVNGPLDIGQALSDAHFTGSMSDVAVFPTALSGAQVSAMWAAYKNSANLVNPTAVVPATTAKILTPSASATTANASAAGTVKIAFDGTAYTGGQTWYAGGLTSATASATLAFTSDGNLVVSGQGGATLWSSNTSGHTGAVLVPQTDGNLVVYSDATKTTALWTSGTNLGSGNYLTFAPDGSLTIFRTTSVPGDDAPMWTFASPVTNAPGVITTVMDPNVGDRQLAATDGAGDTTKYGYDTNGFLYTVTDGDGDTTTTGHDVRGNTVSKTTCQVQATNTCSTAYYTYWPDDVTLNPPADPRDDMVTSYRDPRSSGPGDGTYLTSYVYDQYGNQKTVTTPPVAGFPNGRTTSYAYTNAATVAADGGTPPPGLPSTTTSAGGKTTTTAYFHNGDIASTTDAAGLATSFTYDALGRPLTRTVVSDDYPSGLVTSFVDDGLNRVAQETDPATTDRVTGAVHTPVISTAYDLDGGVLTTTVSDSTGGDAARTTTYTYDAHDQVQTVKDAANNVTTYGYDVTRNLTASTDPKSVETDTLYDAAGHQLTSTLRNYTGDPANPGTARDLVTESRAYDPAGRLASVTDAMGNTTSYKYTDNGLVASVTRTDSAGANPFVLQADTYDAAGNLISRATNNGATVTNETVDAAARVSSETVDPSGLDRVTTVGYNPDDAVASTTLRDGTPNGLDRTTTASFDTAGRQVGQTVHETSTSTLPAQTAGQTGAWALGDGQSTTAADASGNNVPGTLSGGASWSTDHSGSAVLDGTSGAVTTATSPVDTTKSYTVSAWMKPNATGGVALSQKGTSSSGFILYPDHNLNAWNFGAGTVDSGWNFDQATGPAPVLGAWTYVTGVYDQTAGKIYLYINGALAATGNHTTTFNATHGLLIGAYTNSGSPLSYFNGSVSQVRTYNRALSASEVNGLYVGDPTKGVPQNGLTGQWNLADGNVATAADASGNNHPGTLAGGVSWSTDHGGSAVFNGTTGAIATGAKVVQDTTASFSVSAWADLASSGGFATIVGQDGVKDSGFLLQYDQTDNRWRMSRPQTDTTNPATTNVLSTAAPALHTWTHLVGTFDQTTRTMTLYVNGVSQGSAVAPAVTSATGPFTIGRGQWNGSATNFFPGEISGVQAYNRVLSAAEVASLAGGGSILPTDTTYSTSWHLNERGLMDSSTDADGNVTTYSYDQAGHKVQSVEPTVPVETGGGAPVNSHPVSTVGYDTFGDVRETQDPDGNVVTTAYDADGRVGTVTRPNYTPPGSSTPITAVTTQAYDGDGNVSSVTDPLNQVTSYTYDQRNLPAVVTAPDLSTTHTVYDDSGDPLSVTDGNGKTVQATWDYLARKQTSTVLERYPSAATLTTHYTYGTDGRLSQTTDPQGIPTSYAYDGAGELANTTDAAGVKTSYGYDFMGDRTTTKLADGSSTVTDYDALQLPYRQRVLDPLGVAQSTTYNYYDANGNLTSSTDGRGNTTTFAYDASGVVTSENQPKSGTGSGTQYIATSFGYDAAGNQTRYTDGNGNNWITTYNSWNQPESYIEPATGVYTASTDRTFTTAYDADGRAASVTQPGGVTLSSTYDVMGNLHIASGSGAEAATATRTFSYDHTGRVTSAATSAAGSAAATSESFAYNDRGELLTAAGSAGSSSFSYTGNGSMASRADASGTTNYGYDSYGRLQTVNDAASGNTLTYSYNGIEQVSQINYGTGQDYRTFGYDASHRVQTDTLKTSAGASVASISYGYDANNNLTSKTTSGFSTSASNTYTYDEANRLLTWNNGTATVNYGYDNNGNRTQVGSATYTYDSRDQLTGDGTTTYGYSARGTQTSQTTTSGGNTAAFDAYGQTMGTGGQSYTYDALGRTVSDTTSGGGTRTLTYSGTANLVAGDGSNIYSRDPAGDLLGIGIAGQSSGSGLQAMTDLHTDVVADFTATGAALSGSTAYDPLGNKLGSATVPGALGYQSEWTEPGNGQVNMAARWYNPKTGQFTSRDTQLNNPVPASANANPFAYANDGPLTGTDPTGHMNAGMEGSGPSSILLTSDEEETADKDLDRCTGGCLQVHSRLWQVSTTYVRDSTTKYKANKRHQIESVIPQAAEDHFNECRSGGCIHAQAKLFSDKNYALQAAVDTINTDARRDAVAQAEQIQEAEKAREDAAAAAAKAKSHGFWGFVKKAANFVYHASGLSDIVDCATNPSVGSCVQAVMTIAMTVGTGGESIAGELVENIGKDLLESGAKDLVEAGAKDAVEAGVEAGVKDGVEAAVTDGAEAAVSDGAEAAAGDAAKGSGEEAGSSAGKTCEVAHSFIGKTHVLLADGSTKAIDQVKVGDVVANAQPGKSGVEKHKVDAVIVTKTDHDYVDVTVKTPHGDKTITTTFHHPFYAVNESAFVQAVDLKAGDKLQTVDGTVTVDAVRAYHATQVTYDLTIDGLHTYYVEAGDTPVLVHNCAAKIVAENDAGRFGDLNPGVVGDGLEAHHMPQDGLGHLARDEGGAIVMKAEDHALTRTYKAKGRITKAAETGLPFRTVLARDIWDIRQIGQSKYGDPGYYNQGIQTLLAYYRRIGKL